MVQSGGSCGNVLKVAEHASGHQHLKYFLVQCPLSLVNQMMDRKTRDDGVKLLQLWQTCGQIMRNDSYKFVFAKLLAKRVQHGWRKIDRYEFRLRPGSLDQCQKPAGPTAQIENAFHIARQKFEQR